MEYYNTAAMEDYEAELQESGTNRTSSHSHHEMPPDNLGHVNPYFEDDTIRPENAPSRQQSQQSQPGINRHKRATSMASSASYHSDDDDDPDDVVEQEILASSLKDPHSVLDLLPSRQLGTTLAAVNSSDTWLRKRKSQRNTLSVKRGRGDSSTAVAVERITANEDMTGTSALAEVRRRNTIKSIPGSIETKRRVRDKVQRKNRKRKDKSVGCFTLLLYNIGMGWQRFKNRVESFFYSIDLWGGHIKKIEGNFGSGVTSYFTFLRWLLILNLPVFLLSLSFVTVPQWVYQPSVTVNQAQFSGWDLLTGMGWLTETELYYGYYTNETFSVVPGHYYNMPVSYLFTCGGYSIFILIAVLYSMSKAYRQYYIVGRGDFNYYITKVFCSWDYNITAKKSAKLKHKSIYLELAEQLSTQHAKEAYTKLQTCGIWLGRLCSNLFVLALIAGACAGVIIGYQRNIDDRLEDQTFSVLIMPLIICGLDLLLPPVFGFVSNYEGYRSPRVRLYITMARTILLKAALLVVLIHFWLERSSCGESNFFAEYLQDDSTTVAPNAMTTVPMTTGSSNGTSDSTNGTSSGECVVEWCWETEFGQELYRLVVIDFIFLLLTSFSVEFLRRIFSDYCCKSWSRPEFDIARNTMELIQAQALTWLGMFFAPLLIVICILKLVVLFYVKRFSVISNCSPSLKPWRAGRTTTVFIGMLLLMFFITAGSLLYTIVRVAPSNVCGPFRHLQKIYDVVFILLEDWASSETLNWIYSIIDVIASPGSILLFIIILCLGVYYYNAIAKGSEQQMNKLRYQISVEGKDKMFLLQMLQDRIKLLPRDEQLEFKASLTRARSGNKDTTNGSALHAAMVHYSNGDVLDREASAADVEAWIEEEGHNTRQS